MNVSKYFAACSDGVFAFQTKLGLARSDIADGRSLSFVVVRAESDFISEIAAGETIRLQTCVLTIGNKFIVFHHRLLKVENESVAFETNFRCVLLDLKSSRAVSIPNNMREQAQDFLVEKGSNQSFGLSVKRTFGGHILNCPTM